jgi:hypothetical protein
MESTRPCKYCGHQVAMNAKTCPGCGGKDPYPLAAKEWLLGCAGVLALSFLLMGCCMWGPGCFGGGSGRKAGGESAPAKQLAAR